MPRHLSDEFIADLLHCHLKSLLKYIKCDNTLDLEIRNNYINIYYRGGNVLRVEEKSPGYYDFHFEEKYLNAAPDHLISSYEIIMKLCHEKNWNAYFPHAKQAMDLFFNVHPKEERELQQMVIRDNNCSSIANSTDYFIIDIEYDNHNHARFDLVAIEWESTSAKRKLSKGYRPKLVVIELKHGEGAIKGDSGLVKHIEDFKKFNKNPDEIKDFKDEMNLVFKQKRKLGLIPCLPELLSDNSKEFNFDENIEMIFLIANHDPASSILRTQLSQLPDKNVGFVVSNFCGFGLYKQNIFSFAEFTQRFQLQI
jgi:hypothetical protein